MASTQLPRNVSTAVSETTTKNNSDFCFPYTSVYFEIVGSTVPYTVNAALNVPLAIAATFTNILVFAAVRHSPSIRLPSKLLLCSLVLTDVGVGLVVQPQFVTFLIMKVKDHPAIACYCRQSFDIASATFTSASVSTMTAISLDRYIALFFHLKYHEIVTTRRVCVVLAIVWSLALFYASTWFWNTTLYSSLTFCGLCVCFLVISVAYIKIYRGLRQQYGHQVQEQAQVQAQQQAGNTLDLVRYRRSASSMLWIYSLFILCYLPYFCVRFVSAFLYHNVFIHCIIEFSLTAVFLNSCLNPFIYCLRLPEIRAEVLRILRINCGQSPQQWVRSQGGRRRRRREVLLHISSMGMCRPKGFGAVSVWNSLAFLVWDRVRFWQGSVTPHVFIYFSCYFDIDQGHSVSKQIGKGSKPRRKVIGFAIKGHFKWSEKGSGK